MKKFKLVYIKYPLGIVFILSIISILSRLINIYSILISLIILFTLYSLDKKLFKKILYKILYKDKNYRLGFKDKFSAAKKSLDGLDEINKKIKDKVKMELLNYEKNKLETQLKTGDYNVILFGAGSSGKTSIARSLLKNIIGKTSPTIGTTKEITSYKIRIPILKRNINIIDTPGLFESSKLGEKREKLTILKASNSDLILFVLDQDINKYEQYLIKKLVDLGKKIIIVLNKCDLRSKEENYLIHKNINNIVALIRKDISVVKTIASPKLPLAKKSDALKIFPEVSNLYREIIEILDENGEELLAENILFRTNKLGLKSKNFISEQRLICSKKLINKYMWITGGVVLVNPLPVIDLLTTTSVNVQMIMELSKIYEVKITSSEAKDLSISLLSALAKVGIVKGGLSIISSTLSASFTTVFISKTIQSITSVWIIKIVGFSLIEYFKNDQSWGDEGIQEIVQKIYRLNKKEETLNIFINEAISKLKIKKDNQSFKKLPPYFK